MLTNNPFSILSEIVPALTMQIFVVAMGILVIIGTLIDVIHKKNVKYFFENAKKAKKSAKKNLLQEKKLQLLLKQ